ncbi:MAG: prepilin peptidase [Alphaproteobacteria bacterium]|nr:prepilin peptidase [Alphaproteobacteria bacterium]
MILHFFIFSVVCAAGIACITDLRGMKIPNAIPTFIMGAFIAFVGYSFINGAPLDFFTLNFVVGGVVFVLTFILFALKAFGAGDAKLATALSFWVGIKGIAAFLFFMTVIGGLLGVVALVLMKKGVPENWQKGWLKKLAEG